MQRFHHAHRVIYAETTLGNHVYHSRYLDYLEAARGAFFRSLGVSFQEWQDQEVIFPVLDCRLQFLAPARYDDLLDVALWVQELGRIRLSFGFAIARENHTLLVEGWTKHVCTNLRDKPRRIPAELAAALQPFLEGVPPASAASP